jgi:hypothetical protein
MEVAESMACDRLARLPAETPLALYDGLLELE